MNKDSEAKGFKQLEFDDKDLTMFTITDLRIEKKKDQVHMVISLKRKIQIELLTTYLPTLLLLFISYATTFFKSEYFDTSVSLNLTIMLVMTTIFTGKIEELPPTSDTKMIDIWLIFCLLVPFAFTLVQTAIESYREVDTKEDEAPNGKWARARARAKARVRVEEEGSLGEEVGNKNEEVGNKNQISDFSVDMLRRLNWAGWQ